MIEIAAPHTTIQSKVTIGGSKSISNRLLMIKQLFCSDLLFSNLSDSEDTQLLSNALKTISNQTSATINVHHAGTDMRFLSALLAVTKGDWILTGSSRMKERPIGELVSVLNVLGANISFIEKENYPPLRIQGKKLNGGTVEINAGISSQFISALLLIAPSFQNGLSLGLKGKIVSKPYIDTTISLLKDFGVSIQESDNNIYVSALSHIPKVKKVNIESDWSSASYYFSICALSRGAKIELSYFNEQSFQADSILPMLFKELGVQTQVKNNVLVLESIPILSKKFTYDCGDCPDIAQTLAVTCFGLGIACELSGLSTLKLKESDRIVAMKTELEKFGAKVKVGLESIQIEAEPKNQQANRHKNTIQTIETYNDHRMAMSFAPLSLVFGSIKINNPTVVIKSYPKFWEDLKSLGFNVNLQA